jgi:hypothetical protein
MLCCRLKPSIHPLDAHVEREDSVLWHCRRWWELLMKWNFPMAGSWPVLRPCWLGSRHLFGVLTAGGWIILGLLFPNLLSAKNIYVAQTALGAANGQDAADAYAVTWLNSSGNWGSGAGMFNPGDTVYLVGTITSQISIQASGTAGSPYTILFSPGANMTSGAWPSSGAIWIGNHSWITVDGGPGHGIIQNTNNGDLLGQQVSSSFVAAMGGNYNETGIEIRNLTMLNCYIPNPGNASSGAGGSSISINSSGTNVSVHDCLITNGGFSGISFQFGSSAGAGGSDNFRIYNNSVVGCNWDIVCSIGSDALFASSVYVYSNYCGGNWIWDTGAPDTFHHNGIMVFVGPPGTSTITNIYIFNNKIGPDLSKAGNDTAWIFVDWNGTATCFQNCWVYNNVLYSTNGYAPQDAFITGGAVHMYYYNNSIYAASSGGGMGGANTGQTSYYSNNIVQGTSTAIGDNGGAVGISDYNDFYNAGGSTAGGNSHGMTTNPKFNNPAAGDLTLQSGSPCIGAGANISSCFTYDITGKNRPSSGAWDIGAYEYAAGTIQEPVISNVQSSPATNAATITWTTDQSANSIVNYGLTTAYGSSTTNSTLVTSHQIILSGLASNTLYHFQVRSIDSTNSVNSSGDFTFTAGPTNNLPPTVSAISANVPDMGTNSPGLQIYEGTAVQFSASASAPNGDALTWQWLYTLNGGTQTVYQSGSGASPTTSFSYPAGTAGNTYVWTLQVTDSQTHLSAQSQLTLYVQLEPPQGFRISSN